VYYPFEQVAARNIYVVVRTTDMIGSGLALSWRLLGVSID
jgi:hypothetical protein